MPGFTRFSCRGFSHCQGLRRPPIKLRLAYGNKRTCRRNFSRPRPFQLSQTASTTVEPGGGSHRASPVVTFHPSRMTTRGTADDPMPVLPDLQVSFGKGDPASCHPPHSRRSSICLSNGLLSISFGVRPLTEKGEREGDCSTRRKWQCEIWSAQRLKAARLPVRRQR